MTDPTFLEVWQQRSEGLTLAAERVRMAVGAISALDPDTIQDATMALVDAALDVRDESKGLVTALDAFRVACETRMKETA